MKMISEKRAIDKIFRRRDRYDIPDWQRQEVWNRDKKQRLIDSILRGWKLPKFYFIEGTGENYLVEDGQQRLNAIWEFFSNELPLSTDSAKQFDGRFYRDLPRAVADSFDDFEINACSNAQSARVQVLTYSADHFLGHLFSPHISGKFEVGFSDGTSIDGTFTAKERRAKKSSQAVCE